MKTNATRVILAVLFFLTRCTFSHAAEATLWSIRLSAQGIVPESAPLALSKINTHKPNSLETELSPFVRVEGPLFNSKKPIVILMQDVHLNEEAQRNMAEAAHILVAHTDKNWIWGLEGTVGPLAFAPFLKLKNRRRTGEIAQRFLKEGKIGALMFLALGPNTSGLPATVLGLESARLYLRNIEAYRRAQLNQNRIFAELDQERRKLLLDSPSMKVRSLLLWRRAYEEGRLTLSQSIKHLSSLAHLQKIPSLLDLFQDADELETTLRFSQAFREREWLIKKVALTKQVETTRLLSEINRNNHVETLRLLLNYTHVSAATVPELTKAAHYQDLVTHIDANKLYEAMVELEASVIQSMKMSDSEIKFLKKDIFLMLCSKLTQFSLTPSEWNRYQTLRKTESLPYAWQMHLISFEQFYALADARSEAMASQLPSNRNRILITGGFHTPTLKKIFEKQGAEVTVLSPRITHLETTGGTKYLMAFLVKQPMLSRFFQGQKLFLGLPENLAALQPQPNASIIRGSVAKEFEQEYSFENPSSKSEINTLPRTYLAMDPIEELAWRNGSALSDQIYFLISGALASSAFILSIGVCQSVLMAIVFSSIISLLSLIPTLGFFLRAHKDLLENSEILFGIAADLAKQSLMKQFWMLGVTVTLTSIIPLVLLPSTVSNIIATFILGQSMTTLLHRLSNHWFLVPASTGTIPSLVNRGIFAMSLMDVGATLDKETGQIIHGAGIDRAEELLPLIHKTGFGYVYAYGLFEPGELSRHRLHDLPDENPRTLTFGGRNEGKTHVERYVGRRYRGQNVKYKGQEVVFSDTYGNIFSPIGFNRVNAKHIFPIGSEELSKEEKNKKRNEFLARVGEFAKKVHANHMRLILDFVPWFAPDEINSDNYRWFFHVELNNEQKAIWERVKNSPEERKQYEEILTAYDPHPDQKDKYHWAVVPIIENGFERLILVRHVSILGSIPHKDQFFPNILEPEVQNYYFEQLTELIDLGVDGVRVDLIFNLMRNEIRYFHQRMNLPYDADESTEVLELLIDRVRNYAHSKGHHFRFIGEAYDFDAKSGRNYREILTNEIWEGRLEVYFENIQKDYERFVSSRNEYFSNKNQYTYSTVATTFHYLRQSLEHMLDKIDQLVMFPSNYDQKNALKTIGGPILEYIGLKAFLANGRMSYLLDLRDLLLHSGHIIPVVGPDHPVVTNEEFAARIDRGLAALFQESKLFHLLQLISSLRPAHGHFQKPEFLDSNAQHRYFAASHKAGANGWAIVVADFWKPENSGFDPKFSDFDKLAWVSCPSDFISHLKLKSDFDPIHAAKTMLSAMQKYELFDPRTENTFPLTVFYDPNDNRHPFRMNVPDLGHIEGPILFTIRHKSQETENHSGLLSLALLYPIVFSQDNKISFVLIIALAMYFAIEIVNHIRLFWRNQERRIYSVFSPAPVAEGLGTLTGQTPPIPGIHKNGTSLEIYEVTPESFSVVVERLRKTRKDQDAEGSALIFTTQSEFIFSELKKLTHTLNDPASVVLQKGKRFSLGHVIEIAANADNGTNIAYSLLSSSRLDLHACTPNWDADEMEIRVRGSPIQLSTFNLRLHYANVIYDFLAISDQQRLVNTFFSALRTLQLAEQAA